MDLAESQQSKPLSISLVPPRNSRLMESKKHINYQTDSVVGSAVVTCMTGYPNATKKDHIPKGRIVREGPVGRLW